MVTPTEEDTEEEAAEARAATYDYLLSMTIASLTAEKVHPCTVGQSLCKYATDIGTCSSTSDGAGYHVLAIAGSATCSLLAESACKRTIQVIPPLALPTEHIALQAYLHPEAQTGRPL